MDTAGGLSAKMFIDIQQAQQALQNINTLLKVSQKNFQELGKQGIYTAAGEFKKFDDAVKPTIKSTEQLGEKTKTATQEYRQFFKEQRFQGRMLREGKEAIMGVAFAFMMLSSQGGETSETMRSVTKGLVGFIAGMNSSEFAIFSLGRAMSGMTGSFGKFGTMLMSSAGWIGAVVGVGAGLIAFFSEVGAASKKAAEEGLKKFNDELQDYVTKITNIQELTRGEQEKQRTALIAQREMYELQIGILDRIKEHIRTGQAPTIYDWESEKAGLKDFANFTNKEIDEKRDEAVKKLAKTQSAINAMGAISVSGRLKTEKEITDENRKQAEEIAKLEAERDKIRKASTEKGLAETIKAYDNLYLLESEMNQNLITDKYDAERNRAEQEHSNRLANIHTLVFSTLSGDEAIAEQKRLDEIALQELKIRNNEINKRQQEEIDKIRLENEKYIAQIREQNIDSIINSLGRLQSLFGDAGNEFIKKLQIALQIVQKIEEITARTAAQKTAGGVLGEFSDIISLGTLLLGLFKFPMATGGYTGAGSRNEPAGVVHRGEIVFEKPIVDRYGSELMALRANLKGYAGGGKVDAINVDSFAMISNNALLNEVRALRQQNSILNETMKRAGDNPIVIQANLDALQFLRKYKPEYDKFEKKKTV